MTYVKLYMYMHSKEVHFARKEAVEIARHYESGSAIVTF